MCLRDQAEGIPPFAPRDRTICRYTWCISSRS
jgi:hypothetical protein